MSNLVVTQTAVETLQQAQNSHLVVTQSAVETLQQWQLAKLRTSQVALSFMVPAALFAANPVYPSAHPKSLIWTQILS